MFLQGACSQSEVDKNQVKGLELPAPETCLKIGRKLTGSCLWVSKWGYLQFKIPF